MTTSQDYSVTVLGGGSFGTALANIAAENGYPARLWLRDQALAAAINADRENRRYMPGYELDPGLPEQCQQHSRRRDSQRPQLLTDT